MDDGGWFSSADVPADDIRRCAADPIFIAAVRDLYEALDANVAARNPICVNRGACCRFGSFGHRLFVTPAELAYFLGVGDGAVRRPKTDDACPYQIDGTCTARSGRPSGCRIFFCAPGGLEWQSALTEQTLARLQELHRRFNLPYAYLDWMQALAQLAAD